MAHRRSPPTRAHTLPISPLPTRSLARRRKYTLRRFPNSRRRALDLLHPSRSSSHASTRIESDESDEEEDTDTRLRPVLAALHQNLRRLPSRLLLTAASTATRYKRDRDSSMRDVPHERETVQIGTKRKRVVSSNENAGGHSTRGSRLKRIKAMRQLESEEDEASGMEVDTPTTWAASEESDSDEEAMNSSDDHLLTTASHRQLLRLRKDELIHLYTAAGLSPPSSFESLTKPEIVDAIVAARDEDDDADDAVELPPSSPRGESEYSSEGDGDDGNVAGGEETDVGSRTGRTKNIANPLRRRATVNDLGRGAGRPMKGRSLSMGQLGTGDSLKNGRVGKGVGDGRRRITHGSSSRSSPTTSMSHFAHLPSPPATRTRSRKISSDTSFTSTSANTHTKINGKGKTKSKQVEFNDNVQVQVASPPPMNDDDYEGRDYDSELTDLAELEADMQRTPRASSSKRVNNIAMPSPRRLRSNGNKESKRVGAGKRRSEAETVAYEVAEVDRRITPMRKAKGKIGSFREDSESVEEEEEEEDVGEENGADEEEDEEVAREEDEVDELASSPSPTPPPLRGRRTPVKRRLRPRRVQTHTPPSDGDDEEEEEEVEGEGEGDEIEGSVDNAEVDEYEDAEEGPVSTTTPRKLRSGRIVGEEDEEDIGEEEDDEEEEEFVDAESIDIDAEGETEEDTDEPMEDDIDLTVATAKTLVRLRRDDLIRLCETRDLEVVGTKPQLASALLEWRDRQSQSGFSSPSSTGTVRASSTIKRRRKSSSGGATSHSRSKTPVLLRSHHFHADEPRTPPISEGAKDQEPELELDLESLGLEDREIPPEKLTKLEKIGSGGFKDVFIGKLKGRKIAISEFRGQLSAMDIKELKLLGGFDHPNIVRFLGVSIPENTRETPVMIVSELCANGDLFDYVRNVHPPSLHKVLNMMLDVARGLEYLHLRKPSVIHRDCKSSNILITSRGTAKIADFGLAKVKQSTRSMVRSLVGTVNWQAPELWHAHPKYNHKVDVFSCAMVYWEMLQWHVTNKKFPWEGMNEHAIYEIVGAKRQRPSISSLRKVWCPEIVDLIERMWAQDHQDRPTMSEVVQELERMVHR